MDAVKYRDILQTQMLPHGNEQMPAGWIFQHDNDPKHTAKIIKEWLNAQEFKTMLWPAQENKINKTTIGSR